MTVKYELDGLELKDVHVETRKRENFHDVCVYEAFATIVRTFEDVNSDA